ncbi:ATP-dependent helicase Hrq1p [Monosporozyma servazzii]
MSTNNTNKRVKLEARTEVEGAKDEIAKLKELFFRVNTIYTFLMCRKHVIPTFETIARPVQNALKRDVTEFELAKIVAIIPRDCEFKYIDENQIQIETKIFDFDRGGYEQKDNDIFQLKNVDDEHDPSKSTQLLIFEFIDGNMKASWKSNNDKNDSYSNKGQINLPNFTLEEMKKMIQKRSERFNEHLQKFIDDQEALNLDPSTELIKLAAKYVPHEKDYVDPIEAMMNAKETKEDDILIDEVSGATRPSIESMINKLKKMDTYNGQIKEDFVISSRTAAYGDLSFELAPEIFQALEHDKFYTHQADALNAIHNGENVIITTSTSSGKSLIYQLSAIDILLKDPEATFMYIFPTKALAQDQKRSFESIIAKIPQLADIHVNTYDGDTEQADRRGIREKARVIFTNPDMIHTSILPNHINWKHFLFNLKIVVVDELHIYRGLFGSNVALVMRRLLRICLTYYNNLDLRFISCSATLKNPIKHMQDIFGISQVKLIHEDGSPRGPKNLVIWNPPVLGQHIRKRENFIKESALILVQLIIHNVRTIAFCFVRRVCELLMKEVRNIFEDMNRRDLLTDVMAYRGGYSPSDRRKIEREMFHGNLKAVISTNALELGIDIGGLDSVLMCGFPLSLANFHQQSGRAGRRNKDSMTLVVASDSPVDQHYVAHPDVLLDFDNADSYQDLILDFSNQLILEGHIQCAAFELPIDIERDKEYFDEECLSRICEEKLFHNEEGYHTSNKFLPWPSKNISLRGGEEDMFAVIDVTNNRNIVIEEVETKRTSFTLYDGGIFIHQGYPYLVKEMNPDEKYALVQRVDVDWVTQQRDYTDVDPQLIEMVKPLRNSDTPVYFGKMRTTIVVFGFFKVDKYKRIIDAIETHNDPIVFYSKGLWIDIPTRALELCERKELNLAGAIHAVQHGIMGIFPRFIVAGVDEIVTECKAPEKEFAERQTQRKRPGRLVFYDSKGGEYGSGLSVKVFENMNEILEAALKRIEECPCTDGCPDCVAGAYCSENCLVLSKPGSLVLLHSILGHNEEDFIDKIPDGPEPNMPEIKVETIEPVRDHVKFAPDFKLVDIEEE